MACAPGTPQGPANAGKEPKMQWEWTQGEDPGKVLGPRGTQGARSLGTHVNHERVLGCQGDPGEEGNLILFLLWIP